MTKAAAYLIKQALPDALGFAMRRPFTDPRPAEFTRDDQKFMDEQKAKLAPSGRRTVDKTIWARREAGGK
jgi:hypothetical protein